MSSSTRPLTLGILADSHLIPAWMYCALERVLRSGCAKVELLLINSGASAGRDASPDLPLNKTLLLFRLINRIDEFLFAKKPDPFQKKDIRTLLPVVPVLEAALIRTAGSCTLDRPALAKLKEFNLDILIQIGFSGLSLASLSASRFGVWHYRHSDDSALMGGPPGFWEVLHNCPETGASLHATGGQLDLSAVLYRSWFFTHPLSPARNRSYFYWAAASFLPRQIERLYRVGERSFLQEITGSDVQSQSGARARYALSSNLAVLKLLPTISGRLLANAFQRLFYRDQWFLLYSLDRNALGSRQNFQTLMPPKDRFWADPMVLHEDGKYYIFLEELPYRSNRGHISVLEMDSRGCRKDAVPVLQKNYHLSYPFVFKWNDKFYMIPESAENRTIDLYACVHFPDKWCFITSLMENVIAVDTTLFYARGKWWLFTAMADNQAAHPQVELFLFYADDFLANKWVAHPRNPVVSDIRTARPAGRMFSMNGKIYRPSQICSGVYGRGFNINEVEVLSETDYREKIVTSVRPDWDPDIIGSHTYANEGGLTVIDALRRKRKIF